MKAKVFYLRLTNKERTEINLKDWDCALGKSYFAAERGAIDENIDRFELAVELEAGGNEEIFHTLNSVDGPWYEEVEALTDFPRSMSVGDFIVWEDGTRERCATCGFETF